MPGAHQTALSLLFLSLTQRENKMENNLHVAVKQVAKAKEKICMLTSKEEKENNSIL